LYCLLIEEKRMNHTIFVAARTDAHENHQTLSTEFVEETEVNDRLNAALEPNNQNASLCSPSLIPKSCGPKSLYAQRYTHPKSSRVEKEPPNRPPEKKKALSPAIVSKEEGGSGERGKGEQKQQNTQRGQDLYCLIIEERAQITPYS